MKLFFGMVWIIEIDIPRSFKIPMESAILEKNKARL